MIWMTMHLQHQENTSYYNINWNLFVEYKLEKKKHR